MTRSANSTSNNRFQGALEYVASGLSLVPIGARSKCPPERFGWKAYQKRRPSDAELRVWVKKYPGLGIVGGKVSGNDNAALEILDLESIAPLDAFRVMVEEAAPGLLNQLPRVETPSGGRHVYYRCEAVEGNQKLAQRAEEVAVSDLPRTDAGALDSEAVKKLGLRMIGGCYFKIRTLIETRGEGGQVLSPLCLPDTHPSGGVYRLINGDLRDIPTITPGERNILLNAARACNEFTDPKDVKGNREASREKVEGLKPGEDYNARSDAFEKSRALLDEYGWTKFRDDHLGELWSRPGVTDHPSGRLFHSGTLYVFSSNAAPFDINQSYSPFAIYTELKHGRDYAASAKALAAQGYGERRKPTKPDTPRQASKQGEVGDAETDTNTTEKGVGKESLSRQLIKLALDNSQLFHDAGGDCYASVVVGAHREAYKVGSRAHKDWLAALLYRETEQAARSETLSEAVTILRAKALYEGPTIEAHVRLAEQDGAIYLDLCDDEWRQVKITESGWEIVPTADSTVRFVRAKGMLPLPEPGRGGQITELRDLLNLSADDADNWPMIVGWLVAALRPCNAEGFDYPVLAIHGEQGSAKSSAQRILRDLVDPNKATLRSAR